MERRRQRTRALVLLYEPLLDLHHRSFINSLGVKGWRARLMWRVVDYTLHMVLTLTLSFPNYVFPLRGPSSSLLLQGRAGTQQAY